MAVSNGDTVSVHYTGRLESGETFDTSEGRDPLTFQVGAGQLIPGFDQGVVGMEEGDKKTLTISPEEGYGPRNEQMVQTMPRAQVNAPDVAVGQVLGLETEDGRQFQATVTALEDETITLDFNHFLAGKTLLFDIEVVGVESAA